MPSLSRIISATLDQINQAPTEKFLQILGGIFENSPWIAEGAYGKKPFRDVEELHAAMCEVVKRSTEEQQLTLIRAHPDLVGRAAVNGTLSGTSRSEQASAGLDRLTAKEVEKFQQYNAEYHQKFAFPFVICARLNKKDAILQGFESRLKNSREAEIRTALEEIYKIAYLRLRDVCAK